MTIPGEVFVLCAAKSGFPDRWIIANPLLRTSVGTGADGLSVLAGAAEVASGIEYWNVEWFSNTEGLLADPTRIRRDPAAWGESKTLTKDAFLSLLVDKGLLVDDPAAYQSRFQRKKSLVDAQHAGNFHEQLGRHLLIEKRVNPSTWWVNQKFAPDLKSVRTDNLYGAVQQSYLKDYFRNRLRPGSRFLDVGCGIGLYTRQVAALGHEAWGVDPSADYIAKASAASVSGSRFDVMPVGTPGGMDAVPTGWADYVFMSDALLFYFVTVGPRDTHSLSVLLDEIRRVLKPGGVFISLEPHCSFFLMPWLGSVERPWAAITEYRTRLFRIVPTMAELVQALAAGGFAVSWMDELFAGERTEGLDERAYSFAREFPLWQLLELTPTPGRAR